MRAGQPAGCKWLGARGTEEALACIFHIIAKMPLCSFSYIIDRAELKCEELFNGFGNSIDLLSFKKGPGA